jgi:hypothetical protein
MKITESDLRKIVRHEAKAMLQEEKSLLTEDEFTDSEYREIVEIIRAELAQLFHTLYRKKNFWT